MTMIGLAKQKGLRHNIFVPETLSEGRHLTSRQTSLVSATLRPKRERVEGRIYYDGGLSYLAILYFRDYFNLAKYILGKRFNRYAASCGFGDEIFGVNFVEG